MSSIIAEARKTYHNTLVSEGILTLDANGLASNADKSSALSKKIAKHMAVQIFANINYVKEQRKSVGQTSGAKFEEVNMQFLNETFPKMQELRPGIWHIVKLGNRNRLKTSSFAQYEHLEYLARLTAGDAKLAASMGNDYMVAPDVVIYRELADDNEINKHAAIVDNSAALLSDIRKRSGALPVLHASISAKWTMRSDRAQNSRTEALGLIRNRKGRLPHIVVVTGEPLPSRIASLALGTGDIDCCYHFALYELINAVKSTGAEDSIEMLNILVEGKRLKDISDLPLDLCV